MKNYLLCLLIIATSATACSSEQAPAPTPPADSGSTPPSSPPADNFAPVTSRSGSNGQGDSGSQGGGTSISAPGAVFTLPAAWISETPSSSMRLAQARIPGDAGEGQLTVFHFGAGGGGGLESNLARWIGQVELAAGTQPKRETFESGSFRITWIEVEGTIKPSTMGMGPTEPQPDSRMLAAVVEGAEGPWYFKATGPASTLAAQREAFLGMLSSATSHG